MPSHAPSEPSDRDPGANPAGPTEQAPLPVPSLTLSAPAAAALRTARLRTRFSSMGYATPSYRARMLERALEEAGGGGENEVLDWYRRECGPLRPEVFRYEEVRRSGVAEEARILLRALQDGQQASLPGVDRPAPLAAAFPLLSPAFCALLSAEIAHYARTFQVPEMNLRLDDLAWLGVARQLLQEHALPVGRALLPGLDDERWSGGCYGKVVSYQEGGDGEWPAHADASELTMNVCLGEDGFEGSELQLFSRDAEGGWTMSEYVHEVGKCIVHPGSLPHGVGAIGRGKRTSAVVLMEGTEGTGGEGLAMGDWAEMLEMQRAERA
ncbi:hypothetical protein DFJ74DRAFT_684762 [Hyaloraphidium curvatum]|nr:hypothetical protein DFJ74DRAFT_684762 [Hyaloraphidium curvatum]